MSPIASTLAEVLVPPRMRPIGGPYRRRRRGRGRLRDFRKGRRGVGLVRLKPATGEPLAVAFALVFVMLALVLALALALDAGEPPQ